MLCKSQQKMIETNQKIDNAYKSGLEKGFKDGMSNAVDVMFYMTAYVLSIYDKETIYMSRRKLIEIMRRIYMNIDEFRTGQLQTEDFEEIKKEVIARGISLKKDR